MGVSHSVQTSSGEENGNGSDSWQLSNFKERQVIGKGTWGTVRIIKHKGTKEKFALKKIVKKEKSPKQMVKLRRECEILRELSNPLVCQLRDSFEDNNSVYIITDLMSGGDLRYHISQHRFEERVLQFWLAEIAAAILYIHSRNIIHRDIKPDNILLDHLGHCHLADFNVAQKVDPEQPVATGVAGTPAYMAPEFFFFQQCSFEADWWSLGVVMYECFHQERPFDGSAAYDWMQKDEQERQKMLPDIEQMFVPKFSKDAMSNEAEDAAKKFLRANSKQRLGHHPADVFQHSFFHNFPLSDLNQCKIPPLYRPCQTKLNADPILELEAYI
ncbi:AGC/YANK protein kinase Ppk33 [Schizosaccharomyces japonicus yFS275]|uniref:non-specific serine/threonine protein kinase n=1 Tax=Schizosaccharomyces japonicus (strain yFS275 / FY16936) TaxID=402676 RepID=B6K4Z4_SCHJY|nr:AGC/YANK protein kinase Ppk33 [Schizosaccharomyces japonicus yFS275]EEB08551.1 AGC/YANK protein kinase Ppk33 [Schizosaccharomyces japonicus yFS275]